MLVMGMITGWSMILHVLPATCVASERPAGRFDGTISRQTLEYYLSRAITMWGLTDSPHRDDDIRMLNNVGARFAGRAAGLWGNPPDPDAEFRRVAETAALAHKADPDIILQGCVFEAVYEGVDGVPIPQWVFEEFNLPPVRRTFSYQAMLFDNGRMHDHWGRGGSVPDMSKIETRMWFFYRARRYLDAGLEAIHFGQVHLMDQNDASHAHWSDMLHRVRRYASAHARRHLVLCDAHTHGVVCDGRLLFDFHAFPLRIREVPGSPQKGELAAGYLDTIFGRSRGGLTPSGWQCEHLPYLVEIDNYGSCGKGGRSTGDYWPWGYDEICWFAHQPENYRNEWLRYAWNWVRTHDPNGWLQMPGSRCLADPVNGSVAYYANTKSSACPDGFNQEQTIKSVWSDGR